MAHKRVLPLTAVGFVLSAVAVLYFFTPSAVAVRHYSAAQKGYGIVIGIDLGNVNARVAWKEPDYRRIFFVEGSKDGAIPTRVKFTNTGPIVGFPNATELEAAGQVVPYPKDFIGLSWTELMSRRLLPTELYEVQNVDDKMAIKVKVAGDEELIFPEHIAALLMSELKLMAEADLETNITHAVVSVPDNYNDAQREAIKAAGEKAGLTILQVMDDSKAIEYAYGFERTFLEYNHGIKVLVLNLGEYSLQLKLMSGEDGNLETIRESSVGIGSGHFTQQIVDLYLTLEFTHITRVKLLTRLKRFKEGPQVFRYRHQSTQGHIGETSP
jgi:molecular chaperone DnaK (HSP70)